jgi:hypothetical protein
MALKLTTGASFPRKSSSEFGELRVESHRGDDHDQGEQCHDANRWRARSVRLEGGPGVRFQLRLARQADWSVAPEEGFEVSVRRRITYMPSAVRGSFKVVVASQISGARCFHGATLPLETWSGYCAVRDAAMRVQHGQRAVIRYMTTSPNRTSSRPAGALACVGFRAAQAPRA